jgi:hypothetical protein
VSSRATASWRDHEFFNNAVGDVSLGADDIYRQPLQVEDDLCFR